MKAATSSSADLLYDEEAPIYKIFKENCPLTEENALRSRIGTPF